MLNPQRTIDELKELRALTGDENGAQRVAFTQTWAKAREWYKSKLAGLPVEYEVDEAGNTWTTLRGESEKELLIGGHLDSVPNGGWLDGCLNVMAALEVLRNIASRGTPPVTVRVVDWADEEGARFGRSLFGSSACSGTMNPDELRNLKDKDGILLVDAIKEFGLNLDTAKESHKQLRNAAAYLEL
ncbi:MAG: M20/M25/M40 family metallo-hydrolase, partial [Anaerolineae bacterium]|nr:M20/M25/M40 family metallo-hydrolase [Anaerolineae bacterium]